MDGSTTPLPEYFHQPISMPTNALYARMLDCVDELYGPPIMREKAQRIRNKLREAFADIRTARRERQAREDRRRTFEAFVAALNEELAHAQRSRKPEPTRRKVEKEFHRLKLSRVYHQPKLEEMRIPRKSNPPTGNVECAPPKGIGTYRVRIEPDYDKLQADGLLDGLCVWVTNHTETGPDEAYLLSAHKIIWAYRNKTHIEDAFKHVKSFLKIRPFFVHTQEHVVAVYTLCVVAYFLNRVLANRRQQTEGKNALNTKILYSPFNPCKLITLRAPNRKQEVKKLVARTPEQQQLLNNLGLTHLENPPWLRDNRK